MKTFEYYKHLKKESVRVLTENGMSVRNALTHIRNKRPYLFFSKTYLDKIDQQNGR